jgi:Ca-activated chloride channel family protein
MKLLLSIFCTLSLGFQLQAQDQQAPSPIIFIYDASGSMWADMEGNTKMQIAADVLAEAVDKLPENQPLGLVAYGHRRKGDCTDVEFLVDVNSGTKAAVNQSVKAIKPLGKTPLAHSAEQVIAKLRTTKSKATIILITDGIESCGGDICAVITAAKAEGLDFRLHIIGFGLKEGETEQLKCAANAGDGKYYDAADAGGLSEVLNEATAATVDNSAGNVSVFAIKNGEPIDAFVQAYLAGTKERVKAARSYADTAFLYLPAGLYDIEVKPLENSDVGAITISGIQSFDDKIAHETVSFDGGKIVVNTLNNGEGWDAVVKIYSQATGKVAAGGRTYGMPDPYEVNPGVYDVEVTALILEGSETTHRIKNVVVKGNAVQEVEHNFKSGIALIGANSAAGLVDAVVKITDIATKKNVAGGRTYTTRSSNPKKFLLNPGTYEVTLSALGDFKGKKEVFTIRVEQGKTLEKIMTF